ncbi:MAG: KGK domain-containing protein [Nostoc sp.]|uniref:KGK domain-containing protein n=1 Tax=Nostoc sp. TaxID=1180 RepID=UPI002FFCD872
MNDRIILSAKDVVSVAQNSINSSPTSTVRELMERLKFSLHGNYDGQKQTAIGWVENGVPCELLSAQGGGWQKGRIRIRFEFVPDEPTPLIPPNSTSPLDDLRSQLNPE